MDPVTHIKEFEMPAILQRALAITFASAALTAVAQKPPSWVPPNNLTQAEMNVAVAYQVVFGRLPDLGGLTYWAGQPMSASLQAAVTTLSAFAPETSNYDWIKQVYSFLLGRSLGDDRSGIRYWACQMRNDNSQMQAEAPQPVYFCSVYGTLDKGGVVQSLVAILDASNDASYRNRKAFLNWAMRVQKYGVGRKALDPASSANLMDMQTLLRRVSASGESLTEALNDLNRLTDSAGRPNPVLRFDQAWSAAALWAQSADPLGTGIRVNRSVVWYNRAGQMMVGHVSMRSDYPTSSNNQAVIALHSGGWKEGTPDTIGLLTHEFASSGYVVFAPGYRLTASGYASPAQEQDVEDFFALVKANAANFKVDASKVRLFGYSAGGHLAALLGSRNNAGCVATYAAPLDLRRSGQFAASLNADIAAYAKGNHQVLSPTWRVQQGSTTSRFVTMHGSYDGLVAMQQAADFGVAVGGGRATLISFTGGHLIPDSAVPYIRYHASVLYGSGAC